MSALEWRCLAPGDQIMMWSYEQWTVMARIWSDNRIRGYYLQRVRPNGALSRTEVWDFSHPVGRLSIKEEYD